MYSLRVGQREQAGRTGAARGAGRLHLRETRIPVVRFPGPTVTGSNTAVQLHFYTDLQSGMC